MRTFGVNVSAPHLDDHLCFLETAEEFAVEAFVQELCSVVPASLQATEIVLPWACNTSIWRSFVTICSAASLFRVNLSLLFSPFQFGTLISSGSEKVGQVIDTNQGASSNVTHAIASQCSNSSGDHRRCPTSKR